MNEGESQVLGLGLGGRPEWTTCRVDCGLQGSFQGMEYGGAVALCELGQIFHLRGCFRVSEDEFSALDEYAELDIGCQRRHGLKVPRHPENGNGCLVEGFPLPMQLVIVVRMRAPVGGFGNVDVSLE